MVGAALGSLLMAVMSRMGVRLGVPLQIQACGPLGFLGPRPCLRQARLLHLEPEDLAPLTIESAAMARVPLAGTNWIPGEGL